MNNDTILYKITITWWYAENGIYAVTTIYCNSDLLSLVLDKYNLPQVKEISIEKN